MPRRRWQLFEGPERRFVHLAVAGEHAVLGVIALHALHSGLRGGVPTEEAEGSEIITELRNHVAHEIGPIAKPRQIMVVGELPKTRSGKIMRRLLRDIAENRNLGDVTTLADPTVMSMIAAGLSAPSSED